ncbi:hypothetical protein BGX28_005939 [Mortierella sp. GBA30]|nr:hypothetical protein BGX28_005939 [Mortierella sp. GBA30]
MGEFSKRARSQSRPRSRYEDSDEFTSSEYSETDSSYHGHRSRGSRPRKRARYARYSHSDSEASDLKSGTESEESGIDSDAPLAFHKVRPSSCATATSDPAARLSGPMKKLQTEMEQLTDKFATRMHKLELTYRKIRTLNKRINSEMRELSKEIQQKAPGEPGDKTMLSSSSRSTYPGYISAPSSPVSGSTQRVLEPIPPPPSLTPVSSTGRTNQSSGRARVSEPSVMERVAQRAFPDPRARGYMRVFEQSQYQLPIANQSTMSVLSIRNKMVHEKAFTGRASRPMVLNPFSQQTQFEGIAAAGSFDGFIYFWDINTQKVLLSVPPTEHHVIPFPETLTWVAPDTIVAVSHLKDGIPWPEAVSEMNGNPSSTSLPDTQTNLLTIYFRGDGTLGFKIVTITSMPHTKPINTVTGAMKENGSMSYITGGADKRLYHWRFLPPRDDDSNGTYSPEKLEELHQTHTSAINCTFYSHHSKILYSCGMDSRYVSYDLDAQKIIRNQEPDLGKLLYITQNPVDPRINTLTSLTSRQQYSLMDERTPGKPVLTFGYDNGSTKISKLSVPSWHPDGGLFCTGTSTNGEVMLWDVRWNGIRMENHRRPGTGMVTGNVQFDPAGGPTVPHPIFNGPRARRAEKPQPGGPSQRLDVGGTRCISLLFHPTRNMMIGQSADSSLTFMDYDLRSDPIVVKV